MQIRLHESYAINGCADTNVIVLPDDHKYFDSYLSLALTAFTANKKLNVAIGSPCQGNLNWPMIHVMILEN